MMVFGQEKYCNCIYLLLFWFFELKYWGDFNVGMCIVELVGL